MYVAADIIKVRCSQLRIEEVVLMYRNLEAEMVRHSISRRNVANFLNVRYATVIDKLSGRYPFRLEEALDIKREFFPKLSIEYLFRGENKKIC